MPGYRSREASSDSTEKKKFPRWAKIGLIILAVIILIVVLIMVFRPIASAAANVNTMANPPNSGILPSVLPSIAPIKTGSSGLLGGILTTGPAPGGVFNPVNILPNAVGSIKSLFGK